MKTIIIAVVASALAATLVACGSSTTSKATPVPSRVLGLQTELAVSTVDATIAAGYATPSVALSEGGGKRILTDSAGFTLYVFSDDVPATGISMCTGGCASTWPPLEIAVGAEFQIAGLGLFGEFLRPDDGGRQVMYRGRPLYRYSGDTAPGDTNGDGKDGKWSVAVP